MYAVNIADLTKYTNSIPVMFMLAPVLDRQALILDCEPGRFDGAALPVQEIPAERWEAIHSYIRKDIHKNALRIYSGKGKTWKRI